MRNLLQHDSVRGRLTGTRITRFDTALLVALCFGCIAAWAFLRYPGLPQANDAELHIYRIAELGYSLRLGNLYPRWASDFYHGYGYPIFNYYSPLIYHIGNWLTLFNPENAEAGAKTLFVLAHILGAVGAYLLGREFGGQGGGLLGSAAFAFSPYILIINPHIRGDLAEVFSLSVIPWSFWGWECLWTKATRSAFVIAVFATMVVLLSHNLTGLTALFLIFFLSLRKLFSIQRKNWKLAILAGILIVLLTAYFWLPFLLERRYIQLNVAGEGHYDYSQHFVHIRDLLAFLPVLDWRDVAMQIPMSAGPWILLLGIAGGIISGWTGKMRSIVFYVVFSVICFWLITGSSRWIWEKVPGMIFFQFPWRFLGPFAALTVPLVASMANVKLTQKWRRTVLTGSLLCLVVPALPALYPLPWKSTLTPITPEHYITVELEGRWRGTTSTNDFVPVSVEMIPGPQPSVVESYKHPPVDRVNRYTLPEGTTVEVVEDMPWRSRFYVQTQQKFLLRIYQFYFPGWKAYVDGIETPIEIAHPEGFVTVRVPSGNHSVALAFEDTAPRKAGWQFAALGCFMLGVVLWRFPKISLSSFKINQDEKFFRWILIGVVFFAMGKALILDTIGGLHYISPSGVALPAKYQQHADFGDEIGMLGFDLSTEHLRPGQTLDVTVYWNAQHPITQTYQSFVHLVRPEGTIWSQSDHLNPAGFPTNLWPTDRYISDRHRLTLPADLQPGEYSLSIGLYTLNNSYRLPVHDTESGLTCDSLILSQKIVVRNR
ncbi:MAG: hypothetical protein JXA21_12460 [Anaerolineae bacterium]|nr:hypothetical protein [Anaerolineae bacterium]